MAERKYIFQPILVAQGATGFGDYAYVQDFKNINIELATAGNANMTVKVQGSLSETPVDFTAAASITNPWAYIAVWDYATPTAPIPGATGISFAGVDAVYNLLVNVDGLSFVNVQVTAWAAGTIDATLAAYSNV